MALAARLLGIAPEGAWIPFTLGAIALLVLYFGPYYAGAPLWAATLIVGAFLRDPERYPPERDDVVLSGADGKVVDVSESQLAPLGARFNRVSVFMSPLNVHVNRAPIDGTIESVEHTAGEFRAAFNDHASEHNERNLIVFAADDGHRHAMAQVAGYLARRIVCNLRTNDKIRRGQRIGLIMFGSRVDHFIPLDYRVSVKAGDRVRAGETVIAELAR